MGKSVNDLEANARDLLLTGLDWAARFWDDQMGLLWSPGDSPQPLEPGPRKAHTVRDSVWYALGLLVRNRSGDSERAVRVLDVVLRYQFNEPGQPYHGTFYRAPEEAHPPVEVQEWTHYDPNWREFIMTTVAIMLIEYEDRLPPPLVGRIDAAFRLAVEGALARGLRAQYTNIALMHAVMLCYAGNRLHEPAWVAAGERMAGETYRLFTLHDAFEEYNSPTYYGVDLNALALWRVYAESPPLRDLGTQMEALLWTDIARYYHAGLRNICGPYDRSYGMDMRAYAAVTGEWIWLVTGQKHAPFPDTTAQFAHAADFLFAPLPAILGTHVPAEAQAHFLTFQGERQVEQVISDTPPRVATAWLGKDIMIGAEKGPKVGNVQYHPATVHWRIGREQVGWLQLVHSEPVQARASENRLEISGAGEIAFQVNAPDLALGAFTPTAWQLPGLAVHVETNVYGIAFECGRDFSAIRYIAAPGQPVSFVLQFRIP